MLTAPFIGLEKIFALSDSEDAPGTMYSEVRVEGHLDDARFTAAVRHALDTHPMARARQQRTQAGRTRFVWEVPQAIDEFPLLIENASTDDELESLRNRLHRIPIPLDSSPALRLMLVHHPQGDRILFNFSHALCDGLSMVRIMFSLQSHYVGKPDSTPQHDHVAVRNAPRQVGSRSPKEFFQRLAATSLYRAHNKGELTRIGMKTRTGKAPAGAAAYAVRLLALSADESACLKAKCRAPVSVNDRILGALTLTVAEWNTRRKKPIHRTALLVPVDLRPRQKWRADAIANYSTGVVVSVPADQQTDIDTASRWISRRLAELNRAKAGQYLMDLMRLPLWLLALLAMLTPSTSRKATTSLTNLGKIPLRRLDMAEAGRVTEIYGAPPLRVPWRLSMGVVVGDGQLFISLRYHTRLLDPDAAEEFLDIYKKILLEDQIDQ